MNALYKMNINNARSYIRFHPAGTEGSVDAFAISTVLAIAWGAFKEDVLNDLIREDFPA
jgi:hypothetical protein